MRSVSTEGGDVTEFLPSQNNQSSDVDYITMGTSADDVSSFPTEDAADMNPASQKACIDELSSCIQASHELKDSAASDGADGMSSYSSETTQNDVRLPTTCVNSSSTPCAESSDRHLSVSGVMSSISEEGPDNDHTSNTDSKCINSSEINPSSVSSSCPSNGSQSNDEKNVPAPTVSQPKAAKRQSSTHNSASSVYVSESESESSHASTVRNPFSSGSSLSTVPDEVLSSTSTPDVAETSNDVNKARTSHITGKTPLDGSLDSEASSLCSFGEDSICCSSANDLYTQRMRDRRYSADLSSAGDSDEHLSASQHRLPTSRSRTGTPELRPEAFFLPREMLKASENRPALPERYRHALRKSGSYASLRSQGNSSGSQGNDQDLTSREKDLGSALAWIRHEMMQMKEQDKVLLKRFIELRASILQLRCMYDVLGSTSDLSSMDGSSVSLNEGRKAPRMRNLVRTESDAMMSGGMFKATSSLSLPCSPQLSRLRWKSDDLI